MPMKCWRAVVSNSTSFVVTEDGGPMLQIWLESPSNLVAGALRTVPRGSGTVKDALHMWGPAFTLEPCELGPGEYYPRIWRPYAPEIGDVYPNEWTSAYYGAQNLFLDMAAIFRHVEPDPRNLKAFGHEIRHLLLLACNEVEAQCKAVLRANKYTKKTKSTKHTDWNVNDYRKLAGPMRLHEYCVQLVRYRTLPPMTPFSAWAPGSSGPLAWYVAYNEVKHDREINFEKATLGHLIEALCGVYVLVLAQFGRTSIDKGEPRQFWSPDPKFSPGEKYVLPHVGITLHKPTPYFS